MLNKPLSATVRTMIFNGGLTLEAAAPGSPRKAGGASPRKGGKGGASPRRSGKGSSSSGPTVAPVAGYDPIHTIMATKPVGSKLSLDERVAKCMAVANYGGEIIQEEEVRKLFEAKVNPICYDGFEPSGRMHIAQGILKAINVNRLTSAGCVFVFWVADWFGLLNNKMGGDLEKIKKALTRKRLSLYPCIGVLFIRSWGALRETSNLAHRFCKEKDPLLWGHLPIFKVAVAMIRYPCMQCSDIFYLHADICQLGKDVSPLSCLTLWFPGLLEGQEKMSKSNPDSAIFMEDSEADVKRKIKKAFCPPNQIEGNPCVTYVKMLVFPYLGKFEVQRKEANGGDVTFKTVEEFEHAYAHGELHPGDLKTALARCLNQMIEPVRRHFETDPEAKALLAEIKTYKVTKKGGNGPGCWGSLSCLQCLMARRYDGHDIDRIRRVSVTSPSRSAGHTSISVNPITGEINRYTSSGQLTSRLSPREARRERERERVRAQELYRKELLSQIDGSNTAPPSRRRKSRSPDKAVRSILKSVCGSSRGPMMSYLQRLLLDGVEAAGPVPGDWRVRTPARVQRYSPPYREPSTPAAKSPHNHDSPREWYERERESEPLNMSPNERYAAELGAQVAEKQARDRRAREEEMMRDRILEEKLRRDRIRPSKDQRFRSKVSEEQARCETERSHKQRQRHVIDIDAEWAEWYSRHPEADRKRNGDVKAKPAIETVAAIDHTDGSGEFEIGNRAEAADPVSKIADPAENEEILDTSSADEPPHNGSSDPIGGQLEEKSAPPPVGASEESEKLSTQPVLQESDFVLDQLRIEMDNLRADMEMAAFDYVLGKNLCHKSGGVITVANRRRLHREIDRINSARLPCTSDLIQRTSPRWTGGTRGMVDPTDRAEDGGGSSNGDEYLLESWVCSGSVIDDPAPGEWGCGSVHGEVEVIDGFEAWSEDVGSDEGERMEAREVEVRSPAEYFNLRPDEPREY
ncbi:hypothetical protein FOZ60_013358 [Perkinsus olseni]|uniref:tyrosine--tRNA ligase n=1 Tax=Perkinsus olseni TaxID=32597 RepID=A0A7J6PMP3_PEROL|nr:hypothetical protein FOZ60_013358 [Perkinsus olseni]